MCWCVWDSLDALSADVRFIGAFIIVRGHLENMSLLKT